MNKRSETHVSSPTPQWYYKGWADHPQPPTGVKLQLLTEGGVTVLGTWSDNGNFIAWAPLLQRNKEIEAVILASKYPGFAKGGFVKDKPEDVPCIIKPRIRSAYE